MEEDDGINALVVVAVVIGALQNVARNPVLQHTSILTGQLYFAQVERRQMPSYVFRMKAKGEG